LYGICLFQLLFAWLLFVDWDRLVGWRTLIGYFAGMTWMLLGNALRITLMVVLGNRVSAALVVRYHLEAGRIFFTAVFLIYILVITDGS
jgi:exosortase/archaeosortase family protein